MINFSFLACFTFLFVSGLQLFEKNNSVTYGHVGTFAFMLSATWFALWQVSLVNAEYDEFLRRFHELAAPKLDELSTAVTFFSKEKLQIKAFGIPITLALVVEYTLAALVPLAALNSGVLQDNARAGYV